MDELCGEATDGADDAAAKWLLEWLNGYLLRRGFGYDDTADCAQILAISLGRDHAAAVRECMGGTRPVAWLRRCADNAMTDAMRVRARDQRRAGVPSGEADQSAPGDEQENGSPPLYAGLARDEAHVVVQRALERLRPEERRLLLRGYVGQRTFVELAKEMGSTPDAVLMAVKRAGTKAAVYLLRDGFDPDEYLALMSSAAAPPRASKPKWRPDDE
ncbi:MAG TPA: sigma-70 family RNA polymerase sigma factor [Chthonomonadaceae bacterium]|nr:sigma-70 family RNA polymerase sigma factor [Chthonomonadaceae bacterium]